MEITLYNIYKTFFKIGALLLGGGYVILPLLQSEIVEKKDLVLPKQIKNVIKCRNPRCITSTEQELDHIFKCVSPENGIYRCIYCEAKKKITG